MKRELGMDEKELAGEPMGPTLCVHREEVIQISIHERAV